MPLREGLNEVAIASAAGILATKAMEQLSMRLYHMESERDRTREDPPYRLGAQKTLVTFGLHLQGVDRVALLFHYGLAISWLPVYTVLRRTLRMNPIVAALVPCGDVSAGR